MKTKKILGAMLFMLLFCVFMHVETAFADSEGMSNLVSMTEEEWKDIAKSEEVDAKFVCSQDEEVITDIPTAAFALSRSGTYDVQSYSKGLVIGYGDEYVVAVINVYGDAYFYQTGQVHLYKMGVNVTHIDGCTYTVSDLSINNTDGSISTGTAYVEVEYKAETVKYLCVVTLTGGSTDITVEFIRLI